MEQSLQYRLDMEARSQWESVTADAAARQNLLYLQEAGLFYSGPGYYTTRKDLASYLIKVTLSGEGVLEYQGEPHLLQPGDFFWIDCLQAQSYRTSPDADHWHVIWIHFYGAGAAGYYSLFQALNKGCPVGHLPAGSPVQSILENLLALYQSPSDQLLSDIRSASLIAQALTQCLEAVTPAVTVPLPPPTIVKVQEYLTEHYAEKITLDDLSARFALSKYHLQRTFRHYVGVSPAEYLRKLRLAKAKELLRTTELPISMIAFQLGIDSVSHFVSAFRRDEGITPLQYRIVWANQPV